MTEVEGVDGLEDPGIRRRGLGRRLPVAAMATLACVGLLILAASSSAQEALARWRSGVGSLPKETSQSLEQLVSSTARILGVDSRPAASPSVEDPSSRAGVSLAGVARSETVGTPSPVLEEDSSAYASTALTSWQVGLQADTIRAQRAFPGEIAVYVKELSTGAHYSFNGGTPTYLASAIKVFVMAAVFRAAEAGKTRLDRGLVYEERHMRDGSPVLNYTKPGTSLTVRALIEAMIQRSDNAATDMLIELVGLDAVNQEVTHLGLTHFGPITTLLDVRKLVYKNLDRRLEDLSASEVFQLGVTRPLEARIARVSARLGVAAGAVSVLDYARAFDRYYDDGWNAAPLESIAAFFEALVGNKVVSPIASQAMLEILVGTVTGTRRIRAGLPIDTTLAHKTGTQFRRIGDFGLFYMPDLRPIVFVASIKGGRRRNAEQVIARLTQRSYWHLTPPKDRRKIKPRPAIPLSADPEEGGYADDLSEDALLSGETAPAKARRPAAKSTNRRASP